MRNGICLVLWCGCLAAAFGQPADDAQAKKDQEAFTAYLTKNYPGKKWQTGPTRLDSDEVRAAYGKKRFWFVFSAPPVPPGAFLKEAFEAYQKRAEEFRQFEMSLTVAIDDDGTLQPLGKPEDFGRGLLKVASKDDARIAGAAVLSLASSTQLGPRPVAAKQVTVTEADSGWNVQFRERFVTGGAQFSKDGKLVLVTKQSHLPPPP